MKIGIGTCIGPSLILIYAILGVEIYIVILIEVMFKAFEECKLFIPSC